MVHKNTSGGGGANKKKGMSMEEKIEKVEKWFHAHPHPYTLKELMVLIPKNTGVIYQSIEECLELLVAENRIQQDKVGIHTLFWWFAPTPWQRKHPNEIATSSASCNYSSGNKNKNKRASAAEVERARLLSLNTEQLQHELEEATKEYDVITAEIDTLRKDVGSDEEIQKDQQELNALVQRRWQLINEREKYAKYDPELPEKLKCNIDAAIEAINKWTDNYFILEEYISKHAGLSKSEIRRRAHVPADYDYVDKSEVYDLPTLKMLVKQLREPEEMEQASMNYNKEKNSSSAAALVGDADNKDVEEENENEEINNMYNGSNSKECDHYFDVNVNKESIFKTARELCADHIDECATIGKDEVKDNSEDTERDALNVIHDVSTSVDSQLETANTTKASFVENSNQSCNDDAADDDDAAKVKEKCKFDKAQKTKKRKRSSVVEIKDDEGSCNKSIKDVNDEKESYNAAKIRSTNGKAISSIVDSLYEKNDMVGLTKQSKHKSPQPQGQQRRRKRN